MTHKYSGKVCNCGKGYQSAHDGKCGHCRTKKDRDALAKMFRNHKVSEA